MDVALLLALRELAVAAHGRDGSLLCDEVFDALDAQGQADVASALTEMSQDRLVVVVTHSPEMVKAMRPSLLPGLLSAAKRNLDGGVSSGRASPVPPLAMPGLIARNWPL